MQALVAQLTRKQLYDEIWDISASGVAKKYDIPYSQLLKQVKAANIPIPPSGYWTKISFGKPAEKIALTEPFDEIVSLVKEFSLPKTNGVEQKASPKSNAKEKLKTSDTVTNPAVTMHQESEHLTIPESVPIPETRGEPETIQQYGQTYNIYDRETLYQEVWAAPSQRSQKSTRYLMWQFIRCANHWRFQRLLRAIGQNCVLVNPSKRHLFRKTPK